MAGSKLKTARSPVMMIFLRNWMHKTTRPDRS
jgi:hypothetical protein